MHLLVRNFNQHFVTFLKTKKRKKNRKKTRAPCGNYRANLIYTNSLKCSDFFKLKSGGLLEFKIFREIKMQNYTIIRFYTPENQ